MKKPIKAPERPTAESPREEAEDVDVLAPRFVSSSPPLPTVAKMMSQGINPADAYKEESGDNTQRSSSPPLPGVAKLLAQGINPADEYKEEDEAQKKGAGSGAIPKTKPPKLLPHRTSRRPRHPMVTPKSIFLNFNRERTTNWSDKSCRRRLRPKQLLQKKQKKKQKGKAKKKRPPSQANHHFLLAQEETSRWGWQRGWTRPLQRDLHANPK